MPPILGATFPVHIRLLRYLPGLSNSCSLGDLSSLCPLFSLTLHALRGPCPLDAHTSFFSPAPPGPRGEHLLTSHTSPSPRRVHASTWSVLPPTPPCSFTGVFHPWFPNGPIAFQDGDTDDHRRALPLKRVCVTKPKDGSELLTSD